MISASDISMSYGFMVLVFIVSFAGVVIQTTSGFGYAVTVMSVLPLLVSDLSMAVTATGITSTVQAITLAWRYRAETQWKLLPPILGSFFVTNSLAIRFAATHSVDALRRPMGAFLIILAVYLMFFAGKIKFKGGAVTGCAAGCIAGVSGGLFAIPGPPAVVYMLSVTSSNVSYMATLQAFFFCTGSYATVNRLANGLVTYPVLMIAFPAIAGFAAGTRLGLKLFGRLDPARLRLLVYAVMAASGLSLLITG